MVFLVLLAAAAPAVDYDAYTGWAVDATPVLPEAEVHPSLWFGAEEVPGLRAKRDQDAVAATLWAQVVSSPFLDMPFPEVPAVDADKKTIHQYYGSMAQIAKYNAFMFQMMKDGPERARYLGRAIDALERAFDGPIYDLDPIIKGSPVDEIYIGVWLQNYAAAYDWVQRHLDPSRDEAIRERLARQAEWVADNLYRWGDRPHNHLSKPAWGLASMALAMPSHPQADAWLQLGLEAANSNTRYFFSADGIYREGSHYLVFSWINFVPFLYHYRNVSGVDQFPAFQPVMEWGIVARNGKGWLPNIEDAFIRPFPAHMVAGAYLDAPTRLHPSAPLGNLLQWAYETTDFGPFVASEKKTGFNYTGATWDYTLPLDLYLTYTPGIEPVPPDVSPTVFLDGGQSFFRNAWKTGDPSGRYLLFQGVAEADNHAHEDHLSFILFAENQMMASDGGYTRSGYRDPMRTNWFIRAPSHNVVTLDGSAPVDAGESVTPASRHRIDTDFFDFEEKEAPYPNGGRLKRAVAFPGESYYVVADTVTSPKPAEAVLYLHGGRGAMEGEGTRRTWTFEEDEYGPAARLDAWIFGNDLAFQDHEGEITYIKGDYAAYPYVTASATGETLSFLQILVPAAKGAEAPVVQALDVAPAVGAVVTEGSTTDLFLLQASQAATAAGTLRTDGTFCWIRLEGDAVLAGAVRDGTYVRHRGKTLFDSPTPATKTFRVP